MERGSVQAIVAALNGAGVRYLVVGGLAVVAHGFVRFTADVDLVLGPADQNVRRAIEALSALGYRPLERVPFEAFAHAGTRAEWARDGSRTVFPLASPEHPRTEVDLLLEPPLEFESAHGRAERLEVAPGVPAPFVGFTDLVEMKRRAARPQDLVDIQGLLALRRPVEERP